jgi:hypothetical protein
MSADGIQRGATSFNMRIVYIKQNGNFEKSQELRGEQKN